MKEIFYNDDNLTKEDINESVIRLKALIVNSHKQILLGYSHKTYQFPGGHLELNESLEDGLLRELKEETGIVFEKGLYKPFQVIRYYSKNYRNTGKNRENIIYYYLINTEKQADLNNTNYDDYELEGNYELRYLDLNMVEKTLKDSIQDNDINEVIVREMLITLQNAGLI